MFCPAVIPAVLPYPGIREPWVSDTVRRNRLPVSFRLTQWRRMLISVTAYVVEPSVLPGCNGFVVAPVIKLVGVAVVQIVLAPFPGI